MIFFFFFLILFLHDQGLTQQKETSHASLVCIVALLDTRRSSLFPIAWQPGLPEW